MSLFFFKIEKNKKERQGNIKKINNLTLRKMITWDLNSRPLIFQASALTTPLRKI